MLHSLRASEPNLLPCYWRVSVCCTSRPVFPSQLHRRCTCIWGCRPLQATPYVSSHDDKPRQQLRRSATGKVGQITACANCSLRSNWMHFHCKLLCVIAVPSHAEVARIGNAFYTTSDFLGSSRLALPLAARLSLQPECLQLDILVLW